jgi:hypothetical protein
MTVTTAYTKNLTLPTATEGAAMFLSNTNG